MRDKIIGAITAIIGAIIAFVTFSKSQKKINELSETADKVTNIKKTAENNSKIIKECQYDTDSVAENLKKAKEIIAKKKK